MFIEREREREREKEMADDEDDEERQFWTQHQFALQKAIRFANLNILAEGTQGAYATVGWLHSDSPFGIFTQSISARAPPDSAHMREFLPILSIKNLLTQ